MFILMDTAYSFPSYKYFRINYINIDIFDFRRIAFISDKYNTVILCFKVFFTPCWCYFTYFQRALQLFIQFELIWFDIALFFRKIWILQKFGQILSKADQYWIQTSWNYFWFEGIIDIAITTARKIIKKSSL